MKTSLLLLLVILTATARPAPAQATRAAGAEHFSKDGLSFDYPSGWTLKDGSDEKLQSLVLRHPGVSSVITVFARREPVTNGPQLYGARADITMPYVEGVARRLGLGRAPRFEEARCVLAGGRMALGFRMSGRVKDEPTTAEIYSVALGQRLVHLARIMSDKDEAKGAQAWQLLLGTLKAGPAARTAAAEAVEEIVAGGTLDHKAVLKPAPTYPARGGYAWARGTAVVQVLVDEKGDVVSAQTIAGPAELRKGIEDAARQAKFRPTSLCGRPVRVAGVLTYGYILK